MTSAIEQINAAVHLVAPELILVATVCVMFITGPFFVTEAGLASPGLRKRWAALSLASIGCAAFIWYSATRVETTGTGPFRIDELTWYIRGLTLALGAVLSLIFVEQIDDSHAAEGQACLLAILAGANLTAIANDLVGLFLALELVSIPTYVLLYLPRRGEANQEATTKYMLLSIFSSAIVLYGMSLLYGVTGTTNIAGIQAVQTQAAANSSLLLPMAAALLLAGLSFRIAAVPFHFYAPDVFQGISSAAAAMLSFIPKVVGFVALVRLLPLVGETAGANPADGGPSLRLLLGVLAIVTMIIGNLLALRQQHLHRLLAYSSVAHAGYMLVGLAIGAESSPVSGIGALLFYLAAYGVTTVGVFAILAGVTSRQSPMQTQSDLAGLSRVHPAMALALAVCLFGLTGLPPTAGFTGKLNLFFASWSDGTTLGRVLAMALAANAAVSAWYYLRLIAVMFLEQPAALREPRKLCLAPAVAGAVCSAASVALFIAPQLLWDVASRIAP